MAGHEQGGGHVSVLTQGSRAAAWQRLAAAGIQVVARYLLGFGAGQMIFGFTPM
jgi:hypothetical protein